MFFLGFSWLFRTQTSKCPNNNMTKRKNNFFLVLMLNEHFFVFVVLFETVCVINSELPQTNQTVKYVMSLCLDCIAYKQLVSCKLGVLEKIIMLNSIELSINIAHSSCRFSQITFRKKIIKRNTNIVSVYFYTISM